MEGKERAGGRRRDRERKIERNEGRGVYALYIFEMSKHTLFLRCVERGCSSDSTHSVACRPLRSSTHNSNNPPTYIHTYTHTLWVYTKSGYKCRYVSTLRVVIKKAFPH